MNQEWRNYLIQQGAHLQEGFVHSFGNINTELLECRDGTVICDLSQSGSIKVTGEDAQKFLQNLLSNDINEVNGKAAQFSSFNSPKGRMIATFLIFQHAGEYLLQLPLSLTDTIFKKLTMYVLRSKVKVSDSSDEMVYIGIAGNKADELIKQHLDILLEQNMAVAQQGKTSVVRIAAQRYQINTTPAQAILIWGKMKNIAMPVGASCWDWLTIRAGIPVITPATQEQFVLQMANLDILGGVSFKKGCYPGQEIVARTHYLGKQKRRMYLAHVEADNLPVAGNELFSEDLPGQACGMVINASTAPGGGFDLLGVMQISSYENKHVHLNSAQGGMLNFLPLPYAFPAE